MLQHNQELQSSDGCVIDLSCLTDRQKQIFECYQRLKMPSKVAEELQLSRDYTKKSLASIRAKIKIQPFKQVQSLPKKRTTSKKNVLLDLIEKQQYKCALTGIELTPDIAEIDHITPTSQGGTNDVDNLQWLHREVNRMKGSLDQARFVELCKLVAANS